MTRAPKEIRCGTYGITLAQWNVLFRAQNGQCAICKTTDYGTKGPMVDHCHETGQLRSILCHLCTLGLGAFHDNTGKLLAAADYLLNHRGFTTATIDEHY